MTDLLLTGFLPENDRVGNASRDLILHLRDRLPAAWATALLPQDGQALPDLLDGLLRKHQPRITILCGQAPGRNRLSLEVAALNILDFRVPDALGYQPRDIPAIDGQPLAHRSNLRLAQASEYLKSLGYPTVLSWHAGTFLCNHALFLTLDWLAHNGTPGHDALFLHIPLAPSQLIHEPPMSDKPCMDTAFVAEATIKLGEWLLSR